MKTHVTIQRSKCSDVSKTFTKDIVYHLHKCTTVNARIERALITIIISNKALILVDNPDTKTVNLTGIIDFIVVVVDLHLRVAGEAEVGAQQAAVGRLLAVLGVASDASRGDAAQRRGVPTLGTRMKDTGYLKSVGSIQGEIGKG